MDPGRSVLSARCALIGIWFHEFSGTKKKQGFPEYDQDEILIPDPDNTICNAEVCTVQKSMDVVGLVWFARKVAVLQMPSAGTP